MFYPNPTKDKIIFNENVNFIYVYSSSGFLVKQSEITSDELDLSNLNSGIYILKMQTESGIRIDKLIKE